MVTLHNLRVLSPGMCNGCVACDGGGRAASVMSEEIPEAEFHFIFPREIPGWHEGGVQFIKGCLRPDFKHYF